MKRLFIVVFCLLSANVFSQSLTSYVKYYDILQTRVNWEYQTLPDGKFQGDAKHFSEAGDLDGIITFKNGIPVHYKELFKDGSVQTEFDLIDANGFYASIGVAKFYSINSSGKRFLKYESETDDLYGSVRWAKIYNDDGKLTQYITGKPHITSGWDYQSFDPSGQMIAHITYENGTTNILLLSNNVIKIQDSALINVDGEKFEEYEEHKVENSEDIRGYRYAPYYNDYTIKHSARPLSKEIDLVVVTPHYYRSPYRFNEMVIECAGIRDIKYIERYKEEILRSRVNLVGPYVFSGRKGEWNEYNATRDSLGNISIREGDKNFYKFDINSSTENISFDYNQYERDSVFIIRKDNDVNGLIISAEEYEYNHLRYKYTLISNSATSLPHYEIAEYTEDGFLSSKTILAGNLLREFNFDGQYLCGKLIVPAYDYYFVKKYNFPYGAYLLPHWYFPPTSSVVSEIESIEMYLVQDEKNGWKIKNSGNDTGWYIGDLDEKEMPNGKGCLWERNENIAFNGLNLCKKTWSSYDGSWEHGKRVGEGTFKNDIFTYTGSWLNDCRNGHGKMESQNICFEGEWKDDNIIEGTLSTKDGSVYEGTFENGKLAGKGKITYKNGLIYIGDVTDNLPHGKGQFKYSNGDIYEGSVSYSKPNGQGIMNYANGDVYNGEFKNGERAGAGLIHYSDKTIYDGQWVANEWRGEGKIIRESGCTILGTWTSTKVLKDGEVKIAFPNGDKYIGSIINNQYSGYGTYIWADGRKLDCEVWENGLPVKKFKYLYPDNKKANKKEYINWEICGFPIE